MANHDNTDRTIREAERSHEQHGAGARLLNEAATRDAQGVIRVLLAINGGAAAALLAFSGKNSIANYERIAVSSSLGWFSVGVVAASLAAIFAYCTNYCYAGAFSTVWAGWEFPYIKETGTSARWRRGGRLFHFLGIAVAIASLFVFVIGTIVARQAIEGGPTSSASATTANCAR